MNRNKLFIIAIFILLLVLVGGSVACSDLSGGESVDGTYYYYKNGSLDKSDFIKLNDGKWSDSDDRNGTYKVTNGRIELYVSLFGESEVLYDGTIKDGVMKLDIMGMECYYCKEGKAPSSSNGSSNTPTATTKKYTVTFNANEGVFADGSNTFVQNESENTLLTAPTSPTRQGYSFIGWSKTKNGSDMWQFAEDTITADITLYAKWTEKTAVVLSVDGASISDDSIFMVVDHSTDYVSLATKVECSNDSVWRLYCDRLGLMEIPTKVATQRTGELDNGNNTFYIVVTSQDGTQVNTYELTIHRSYLININYVGVYGTTIESKTTYSGYEYVVTYNPTITGYTFNYWKDASGNKVTAFTPYSSSTLYADCTVNTYTATLDVNGGDSLSKTSYTMTYDSAYSFAKPSRTGYTFLGWYDGTTQITNANGSSLEDWNYTSNKTITAKWQANAYTVTLNTNDSSAGMLSGAGQHDYDSNVTITASANSGYTWVGWYDGNNNLITENTSYTFKMGFDTTYTAKWEYYTLTTSSNNTLAGTISSYSNTKVTVGKSITITATTNSGYTFVGWYDGEAELTKELSYTFNMPAENVTYTAKWTYYTLTTTVNDSSAGSVTAKNETKTSVGQAVTITATTNLGYTWLGWYNGEAELTKELSYTFNMPAENVTYTAKWNVNADMLPFSFTSTSTTLTITGLKDKTASEIKIPEYVTSIGDSAFSSCSSLTSVTIPIGVASIGNYAFQYCSSLTIYCEATSKPGGWGSGWNSDNRPVNWGCNNITIDSDYDYVVHDDKVYLTKYKGTETDISIPQTIDNKMIVSIGTAFQNNKDITSIEIPSSVTSIGDHAFYLCSGLTSVTIPSSVTSIGDGAFYLCSGLTSVTIPSSVTSIGDSAFKGCINLISVTMPSSVTSIGSEAFSYCISLISVTIPSSVTSIGTEVFSYCESLTIVTVDINNQIYKSDSNCIIEKETNKLILGCNNSVVPNYVTSIGSYAFSSCSGLTSITIPSSVTSIGDWAFNRCSSLTSIEIPSSVTSMGDWAFANCSGLTSITIHSSVTSISSGAFSYCISLTSITIPSSVTSIGDYAFQGCSSLTSVTIPSSVTSIGVAAFSGCSRLTSVTIPSSVTSIGGLAFDRCDRLTSMTIPSSVTSIGYCAFQGCSSLTSVTFENTSGWWVSTSSSATSGISVSVTNASTNATNLRSTYRSYYWKRNA